MSFIQRIKSWWAVHLLIFYCFFVAGLIVNFLQLLSCVVWLFNKPLYRKINVHLAYSLWSIISSLGQYWSGTDVDVYFPEEEFKHISKEHCICVMNHKYDIDWLIGWIVCQRAGLLGGSKILGKSSLKLVPIIGWCWIFTESIFIKRRWDTDSQTLLRDFNNIIDDYPNDYFFNILMFCEGTRFTKKKHADSIEFARSKGLPELKHHLYPRTKGFSLLMRGGAGRIAAIYDLNVGIEDTANKRASLKTILDGIPLKAKLFVRRIPLDNVPVDDEKKCSEFLYKLYKEKDEIYDTYAKTGDFASLGVKQFELKKNYYDLYISIFWCISIITPSLYYLGLFIWNGSMIVKILFGLALLLGNLGIKLFLSLTQIERSSDYGLATENSKDKSE